VQGAGTTVPYIQGDRTLAVHHCATCGCITHWPSLTGADRMAVNARLMDERDVEGVRVRRLDGAATLKYLDWRLGGPVPCQTGDQPGVG
jgi:hypothetical protein